MNSICLQNFVPFCSNLDRRSFFGTVFHRKSRNLEHLESIFHKSRTTQVHKSFEHCRTHRHCKHTNFPRPGAGILPHGNWDHVFTAYVSLKSRFCVFQEKHVFSLMFYIFFTLFWLTLTIIFALFLHHFSNHFLIDFLTHFGTPRASKWTPTWTLTWTSAWTSAGLKLDPKLDSKWSLRSMKGNENQW